MEIVDKAIIPFSDLQIHQMQVSYSFILNKIQIK